MNFYIERDLLFENLENEFHITPLTFIKRESIMTKATVRAILGDLYMAKTARTVGLAVLIVIGVLLIILAGFLFWRFKRVKLQEDMQTFDKPQYNQIGGNASSQNKETFLTDDLQWNNQKHTSKSIQLLFKKQFNLYFI